jgi:hypothetical protein
MFRRDSAFDSASLNATKVRPLTGSEMEAAAERAKRIAYFKSIEKIIGVLALAGAAAGFALGNRTVKNVCDIAIAGLAILALVIRYKGSGQTG